MSAGKSGRMSVSDADSVDVAEDEEDDKDGRTSPSLHCFRDRWISDLGRELSVLASMRHPSIVKCVSCLKCESNDRSVTRVFAILSRFKDDA